jgi:hypothetical protein
MATQTRLRRLTPTDGRPAFDMEGFPLVEDREEADNASVADSQLSSQPDGPVQAAPSSD